MERDIRWKQRFANYKKVLKQLESAVNDYADTEIDIIKEGIVQRFEFTHELAWKLMQDILQRRRIYGYYRFPNRDQDGI